MEGDKPRMFSIYYKALRTTFSSINKKYEINLVYIILDYIAQLMYEDVIKELKYTSIIYESPNFIRTGECIYDIVWCRENNNSNHCALYQTYSCKELDNYNSLSYIYDDDLFEKTRELRKKYKPINIAHFLIYL